MQNNIFHIVMLNLPTGKQVYFSILNH